MVQISSKKSKPQAEVVTGGSTKKTRPIKSSSNEGCCCTFLKFTFLIYFLFGSIGFGLYRWNMLYTFFSTFQGDLPIISRLASDFSTTVCEQYSVDYGWNPHGMTFLLDGEVKIDPHHRQVVSITEQEYVSRYVYHYYPAHLLQGSDIQVKGCRITNFYSEAEILVIKGDANWKSWKNDECIDNECIAKRVDIDERDKCSWDVSFALEYHVTSEDNYYIVTTHKRKSPSNRGNYIFTRLNLVKAMYDLSHIRESCFEQSKCTFNLTYASEQNVLAIFPGTTSNFGNFVSYNTDCKLRVLFVVGIFAILPMVIVIFLCLFVCCCVAVCESSAKRKKKNEVKRALLTNHQSSVNNFTPPPYEAPIEGLPNYQAVA